MVTRARQEEVLGDYAMCHAWPPARLAEAGAHHLPLARWIAAQARPGAMLVVGINGAQGSGKSMLTALLQHLLVHAHGMRAAALSLDDFYLTRAERQRLAREVHPLLATRGVPGTHDLALLQRALHGLRVLRAGESLSLPRFVKARDERAPEGEWVRCEGPVNIVLLEGWCVGTPPQATDALVAPVNALEAQEDADGRWRRYVNERLATDYAALFGQLDRLLFLQAPDFAAVAPWRLEQEAGNAAAAPDGHALMDAAALDRFIAHYERLTRHALRVLPARADVVLSLDRCRQVVAARYR